MNQYETNTLLLYNYELYIKKSLAGLLYFVFETEHTPRLANPMFLVEAARLLDHSSLSRQHGEFTGTLKLHDLNLWV